jgi:hypothetical protein
VARDRASTSQSVPQRAMAASTLSANDAAHAVGSVASSIAAGIVDRPAAQLTLIHRSSSPSFVRASS